MELQIVINVILGIAGFFGAYVIHNLHKSIDRMADKVNDIPHQYVYITHYERDISDIKRMLERITDRLESKADKA